MLLDDRYSAHSRERDYLVYFSSPFLGYAEIRCGPKSTLLTSLYCVYAHRWSWRFNTRTHIIFRYAYSILYAYSPASACPQLHGRSHHHRLRLGRLNCTFRSQCDWFHSLVKPRNCYNNQGYWCRYIRMSCPRVSPALLTITGFRCTGAP